MKNILLIISVALLFGCNEELNFDNENVIIFVHNEYTIDNLQGLKYTYVIGSTTGVRECETNECVGMNAAGIGSTGDYLEVMAESKRDCNITIRIEDMQGNVYIEKTGYKKCELITTVP